MAHSDQNKRKIVLFYRTEDYFSQFHPSEFTIDGVKYSCCEQYMMHQKAILFKDNEMAQQILNETEPRKMKACGRRVKNYEEETWLGKCRDIEYRGNLAKFSQNKHLRISLLKTGDKLIAEASPSDKRWGIGLGKKDARAHNPNEWKGTNWLGEALMKVRDELKKGETRVEK